MQTIYWQYRLFMMVHNEADAEDLFQNAAAVMLEKNFDTYRHGNNFTAWEMMNTDKENLIIKGEER